jgi:RNA polymerase sigma factor (sigma-70 family)
LALNVSDADIVRRSINGDAKVFGELFWRHNGAVHGYLARRAGRDTADDLVAEVWLRAFRNRTNFDLQYLDARPWLYGIARNVLHAHWRSAAKESSQLPVVISDPWPDFDEHLDHIERRESLTSALASLSNEEREVLFLVAWEHMSAAAIALMLDVPASTVRSRLHRARAVMRSSLAAPYNQLHPETES